MKNKIKLLFVFLFFLSGLIPLQSQHITLKKDVIVSKDEIQENVVTFGGQVLIEGKVRKVLLPLAAQSP